MNIESPSINRSPARQLLAQVLDPGSFTSWDKPVLDEAGIGDEYAEKLNRARQRTGLDEAVITGRGTIHDQDAAVIVSEFDFLAGSIGVATAHRIYDAVRAATASGLPLIAFPVSGGTRMQEGTAAFAQMIRITAAVEAHKAAGLPYLVYLRNPTTGGVMASWGSLGHVTAAEPGALLGFLGPKVYEALNERPFPEGIQVSENLQQRGIIDAVVRPENLRAHFRPLLRVMCAGPGIPDDVPLLDAGPPAASSDAWESVLRTRRPERPEALDILHTTATDVTFLHGTGRGESEDGIFIALALFGHHPSVVLGHRRPRGPGYAFGPASLRTAQRGMELAAQLNLPLLSIIDTAGADISPAAEEGSLAGEIARSLARLIRLETPTLSVILGQGAGGGALALLPADRIIAAQHGWLAPLPPEGASVILYKSSANAAHIARAQGISAMELEAAGIVDRIVPEENADSESDLCSRMGTVIQDELLSLRTLNRAGRSHNMITKRAERFDKFGRLPQETAAACVLQTALACN
ncbi:carboxyl transferase domain-containing protein [Micrococcaceae bacterium Sec5.7]